MGIKDNNTYLLVVFVITVLGIGVFRHTHQTRNTDNNAVQREDYDVIEREDSLPPFFWESTGTTTDEYIPCLESQDTCLKYIKATTGTEPKLTSYQRKQSSSKTHPVTGQKFVVPNIFHFVRFGENFTFAFVDYVAILSAQELAKAELVFIWGDYLPKEDNPWWIKTKERVANLYYVHIDTMTELHGKKLQYSTHASNWYRMKVIQAYGGIYMDADAFAVRTFDDVRVYDLSMGQAQGTTVCNCIMVGKPNTRFIELWFEAYNTFDNDHRGYNSVHMAHRLAQIFPHLINVERSAFTHPMFNMNQYMYGPKHYEYTKNFAVHIYCDRWYFIPSNEEELKGLNCTIGNIMRHVLYGSPKLLDINNARYGYMYEREHIKHKWCRVKPKERYDEYLTYTMK